jgi:hypothetical protein
MADQQSLRVRQTDGAPHASGDVRRRYANAKSDPSLGLASGQCVDSGSQRLISGNGQIETFTEPVGVQPEQPALGIDDRAARGAGKEWRIVLNASSDSPTTRAAEAALETCDEAQRDAQSSSTRIRESKDRSAEGWRSVRRPFDGWEIPCIDGNDSEITIDILSANLTCCCAPVVECDAHFVRAYVVGVCQHLIFADNHARSHTPALTDADDGIADLICYALNLFLDSVEYSHDAFPPG